MILIDINNNIKSKNVLDTYNDNVKGCDLEYLYININEDKIKVINSKDTIKNKILKLYYNNVLKKDIKNIAKHIINNNIYLTNKSNNYINIIKSKNIKIYDEYELYLKNIIDMIIYFLNKFSNNLNVQNEFNISYITSINTILDNSLKYLDKFDFQKNVVIITDEILNRDFVLKYINRFKIFNIVYNEKIDIAKLNKFNDIINDINLEFGSAIKFVNINDLQDYHVVLINTLNNINSYVFNNSCYKLNLKNSSNDIYSLEYINFQKYKDNINYRVNINNFNVIDIGQVILKYLTYGV